MSHDAQPQYVPSVVTAVDCKKVHTKLDSRTTKPAQSLRAAHALQQLAGSSKSSVTCWESEYKTLPVPEAPVGTMLLECSVKSWHCTASGVKGGGGG